MMSDKTLEERQLQHYNFLFYAHEGLLKFGGSFANALGHLLGKADINNQQKIMICWRKELLEHAQLFVTWATKNRPDLLKDGYESYLLKSKDSE